MKLIILLTLLLMSGVLLSACGVAPIANESNASPALSKVDDLASLIAFLEAGGATVEMDRPIDQAFFSVEGKVITVNGADVQVFEYENAEKMERDSSQLLSHGTSPENQVIEWLDRPHFYKAGRIIALYVGSDETLLSLFEKAMGSQFFSE